jgi:hypothetical protein
MSFLDRFKRKPKPEEESAPAPEQKKHRPPAMPTGTKSAGIGQIGQVLPQKPAPASDDIRLELGDFLHRIPAQLLLPGPHDLKAELRFEIRELSKRIASGNTTINLAEIYLRVPQIFRAEVLEGDNVEIRFPWQKIAKLVTGVKKDPGTEGTQAAEPALADKLRAKKTAKPGGAPPLPPPVGSVLPGRGGGNQASWFTRTGSDKPPEKTPPRPARKPGDAGTPAPLAPAETAGGQPADAPLKLAGTPASAPAATPAGKPPAARDNFTIDDLPADVQRRVATIRGDYERQLAELENQRQALADARDRSTAEAENLRRELENTLNQMAEGQAAAPAGNDLKAQEELRAKQQEIERLRAEIAKFGGGAKAADAPEAARPKRESDRHVSTAASRPSNRRRRRRRWNSRARRRPGPRPRNSSRPRTSYSWRPSTTWSPRRWRCARRSRRASSSARLTSARR